jgi:1-acyl-sn-glycerol-3-phosphate acyltransferase
LAFLRILTWPLGLIRVSWRDYFATKMLRAWGRDTSRMIGAQIHVIGQRPSEPCFFVCNHLSYYDIVLLAGELGGLFVAKSEVRQWPLLGPVSRLMGSIYIQRESAKDIVRANQQIDQAIKEGKTIILFPEATSTRGDRLQPINAPLLKAASDHQLPVYCGTIYYEALDGYPPASDSVCWHLDSPSLIAHIWALLQMPGFKVELRISQTPIREPNRKELARKISEEMALLFRPVC